MIGHRVHAEPDGYLDNKKMAVPGSFGRVTSESAQDTGLAFWQICCPDGDKGSLNPAVHTVTEHDDGTITVRPSIISPNTKWHGWLNAGVWSQA